VADYDIYQVTRDPMNLRHRGRVKTRYGGYDKIEEIPETARFQMGGEKVVYFTGETKDGKAVLYNRVPDPKWT
jgi:hypothetical protein